MRLEDARSIAERVNDTLAPHCERIAIAGSLRRQREEVHDVDMVAIVKSGQELVFNGLLCAIGQVELSGPKIIRTRLPEGISADLYLATDDTWGGLMLIRTGSAAHHVRLAALAKQKGWHLAGSRDGLLNEDNVRIDDGTEQSIFANLGLRYQEPLVPMWGDMVSFLPYLPEYTCVCNMFKIA